MAGDPSAQVTIDVSTIFMIAAGIFGILQRDGIVTPQGKFATPLDLTAVSHAAADIETLLNSAGIVINGRVDQIIQALPVLISLFLPLPPAV